MAQRVRTAGVEASQLSLHLRMAAADRATERATTRGVHEIERAAKIGLTTYSHTAGTPTPSPPGAPPALITGSLMRSVHTQRANRVRRGVYGARVGPTSPYGRAQELGYPPRNLPPRPFLKPRVRASLAKIHGIYRDQWAEAMRT